jgi:putative ABC transport system substrate-binding protein
MAMNRRAFIVALGGAAAWPLAARGQHSTFPVIGFLSARSPVETASVLRAFQEGLSEAGYSEGKNVAFEYRWAEGRYDRLPDLAAELTRPQVAVIAATGGDPSPLAAKGAMRTIPIVFTMGGDPIRAGLVASLSRPGGNVTGTTLMGVELGPKRLKLIRQLVPKATAISMLINPNFPQTPCELRDVEKGAHNLALEINVLRASTEGEIEKAFENIAGHRPDALIIGTDPFLLSQRDRLGRLAISYGLPTMSHLREFVDAGGLISYGPSIVAAYRQAGIYTGQILSGAKAADLPVLQPAKFEMVINRKTARTLGLEIPPMLLALADEVIE